MQNEPILAMLVGPAFGWANRARRSRFGFDEATARWAGPCPAWAGRAFCFCSSRFASTRIQVHLFLPDLARLSCPFFSLLVCVSCSMLPMFLPSLPIPFSLPTIYHHFRTLLLCLHFPRLPSLSLLLSLLLLLVHKDASKQKNCMHSRGVPPFHKSKQRRSFVSRSPQCMTFTVDDTCWYTMHVDSQGSQIPSCEHVA